MAADPANSVSPGRRLAAWGVHLLTATGAVWGFIALGAIALLDWQMALVMMALAMAVDSFDGILARIVRVHDATPGFDGALLDNIVDYLNYVVVPAFFLWRSWLVPQDTHLGTAMLVLLVSTYQFCQRDAKTADQFFRGFPCFWNVAVFYMVFARLDPAWNLAILVALCLGVFVPIKWAYPSRMLRWRAPTLALTLLWGISIVALLVAYPSPPDWLLWASISYLGYYASISLYLSVWLPHRAADGADIVAG